jgi:hypothetical protein
MSVLPVPVRRRRATNTDIATAANSPVDPVAFSSATMTLAYSVIEMFVVHAALALAAHLARQRPAHPSLTTSLAGSRARWIGTGWQSYGRRSSAVLPEPRAAVGARRFCGIGGLPVHSTLPSNERAPLNECRTRSNTDRPAAVPTGRLVVWALSRYVAHFADVGGHDLFTRLAHHLCLSGSC